MLSISSLWDRLSRVLPHAAVCRITWAYVNFRSQCQRGDTAPWSQWIHCFSTPKVFRVHRLMITPSCDWRNIGVEDIDRSELELRGQYIAVPTYETTCSKLFRIGQFCDFWDLHWCFTCERVVYKAVPGRPNFHISENSKPHFRGCMKRMVFYEPPFYLAANNV